MQVLERGRTKGKLNLRRAQMKMAETHPVMAIWLGKVILNQTEPMPYDSGATMNICVLSASIDVGAEIFVDRERCSGETSAVPLIDTRGDGICETRTAEAP